METLGSFLILFIFVSFIFSFLKSERAKKELYGYDIKKRVNEALFCQSIAFLFSVIFVWMFFDQIYGNGTILTELTQREKTMDPFSKLMYSSIAPLALVRMIKLSAKAMGAKKLVIE